MSRLIGRCRLCNVYFIERDGHNCPPLKIPAPQGDERWEEMARTAWDIWSADRYMCNAPNAVVADKITARVVLAFAQVAAEAREEAALAVETMPSTGFLAAKRIRALKSPKKESKP